MIIELAWLVAKIFGAILVLIIARATYLHMQNQKVIQRFVSQGIHSYPGNNTFLVGPVATVENEWQKRVAEGKRVSLRILFGLELLTEKDQTPDIPKWNSSRFPVVAQIMIGKVFTFISDPEAIQDAFVTKSKFLTKCQTNSDYFQPLAPTSFAFMPTNEKWKLHRKTASPFFFKSKLQVMGNVAKEHIKKSIDKWVSEIAQNGETKINISVEFERIFAHTINHICFGQDHNDDKFDFELYDNQTKAFTMTKVSLRQAITNMNTQCDVGFFNLLGNPISAVAKILFDVDLKIGSFYKTQ